MSRRAGERLLFVTGVAVAVLGLFFASQVATSFAWDSVVAIAVIAVGLFLAMIGLMALLTTPRAVAESERAMLPKMSFELMYGGFIVGISVAAALVVGYYQGRNAGLMTFVFAFIVVNALFGLPIMLARSSQDG